MKINKTPRGFSRGFFRDQDGIFCSIQKSGLATRECVWIGIENPELVVFEDESCANYIVAKMPENFMVNAKMHLNREQVKELLPILTEFVETGNF